MKEKLLMNAPNEPEAGLVCSVLEEAGIPHYEQIPGAGSIYAASLNMGVKIYVAEEDYERAKELLDGMEGGEVTFIDFPEGEDETEG